jgi:hypothetical protein
MSDVVSWEGQQEGERGSAAACGRYRNGVSVVSLQNNVFGATDSVQDQFRDSSNGDVTLDQARSKVATVFTKFSTFTAFCNFTGWATESLALFNKANPTDSWTNYKMR